MSYSESYNNIIENLKNLLQIPSVMGEAEEGMPFGRETYKALEYMLCLGKDFGFLVKNVDGYAGHIEWGKGEDIFGILCHLDVVPVGEGWTHPPFGAQTANNKIYARGALDNKSPAIAALYAAKRLKDEGFVPSKKLRIILGLNEESGWKCIDYYLNKEKMPQSGFSPDADFPVINCEKGVLNLKIKLVSDDLKLTDIKGGNRVNMVPDSAYYIYDGVKKCFSGVSAHGSAPHKGVNAIIKMLEELRQKTNDNAIKQFYSAFCGECLKSLKLDIEDEKSGKLTLNVGLIEMQNREITVSVDIRFPVTFTKEYVIEKFGLTFLPELISVSGYHRPLYIPENDELVVKLLDAYKKVAGENARCISIGGATYSRALDKCVAFGPVFPDEDSKIHTADECIDIDNLYKMTDIYYEALKSLL